MYDLKLEKNEKVLKYAEYIERHRGTDYEEIDELYLTNKNIIFAYEKSKKLFSKPEQIVEKLALEEIRVENGITQVSKTQNSDDDWVLQVCLENGLMEQWLFDNDKEIQKWADAISEAIYNNINLNNNNARVEDNIDTANNVNRNPATNKTTINECPYCGAVLDSFQMFCNYCGSEIKKVSSSNAANEFTKGLHKIRSKEMPKDKEIKSNSVLGKLVDYSIKFANMDNEIEEKMEFDNQKEVELENYIINYPIPNSKEDLFEFMFIIISNIDSKKNNPEAKAWYIKLDQVYNKCKILMKDTNDFKKIQEMYDEKRKKSNFNKVVDFIKRI